jgi:hypothetical protein
VRADGDPVVCEVLTNVLHGVSRLALGLTSITPALIARCYHEPSGLFLPAVIPPIAERIPVTWAALAPLALPDLPEQIGHRLVEYLLDDRRFWTAVAPPSVALDEPAFSLREHFEGLRRYWRGPTWVNSAWLLWRGLVRLGYERQASTLAQGITETVSREGLREFYDPGRRPRRRRTTHQRRRARPRPTFKRTSRPRERLLKARLRSSATRPIMTQIAPRRSRWVPGSLSWMPPL